MKPEIKDVEVFVWSPEIVRIRLIEGTLPEEAWSWVMDAFNTSTSPDPDYGDFCFAVTDGADEFAFIPNNEAFTEEELQVLLECLTSMIDEATECYLAEYEDDHE